MNQTANKSSDTTPQVEAFIRIFRVLVVLAVGAIVAYFVYYNATTPEAKHPFKLGLDLAGGSHLVYQADISNVDPGEVKELMSVLRDVIERRINVFGVSEPIIQVEESSFASDVKQHRLVVELPGVTDVDAAVAEIGRTPLLEFKLVNAAALEAEEQTSNVAPTLSSTSEVSDVPSATEATIEPYIETGLTGRYLQSATLEFAGGQSGQLANEPLVAIQFSAEGGELFEQITRDNVGGNLAIFLDGVVISAPRINEAISGGRATISGGFTPDEAKELAHNLNFGALPVPITLESTQTIDATLGAGVIEQSYIAGLVGFGLITLFLMFWYRVPGLIASIALVLYVFMNMWIFQLIPVTLTAAGLAGFVLSLGMAVDANVLVFERMKEEFRSGKSSRAAAEEGFRRAWGAIRDGNITGLISAIILFWFGTAMIKGFALVLGVGIIISVMSAIVLTRTLLVSLPDVRREDEGLWPYLLGTGLTKK